MYICVSISIHLSISVSIYRDTCSWIPAIKHMEEPGVGIPGGSPSCSLKCWPTSTTRLTCEDASGMIPAPATI